MNLRRLAVSSAAAVSLLLTGCAHAGTGALASDTPPPGAVPGPGLWKVADADTTIYLFGTVHALPKDKTWLDPRIERAFDSSGELVTEIDVADLTDSAKAVADKGVLPAGQTLRGMMTPEQRQKYEAALVSLGLPVAALDKYQPWFAAMTLSLLPLLHTGYETQSGVELALTGRPAKTPRKHEGLETVQDQVALFANLPPEAQLAFLEQTIEAIPKASTSLDEMVAEWQQGHADKLADLLNAELTDNTLRERLLTERNARWAQWIKHRLDQPGTVFVAVGAGHLAGRGSVQDQLASLGLKVQRIWK